MDDRISELEIQLKAAQNELAETYKRISELESQDALLRRKKQDAQIRLMVSRTPVNKLRGRVPDLDFQEWQKAIEAVWKRKINYLKPFKRPLNAPEKGHHNI